MTAVEHIIAWIESSQPEYERLVQLERDRGMNSIGNLGLAREAFEIAASSYRQMVRGGDAWASDHGPETILDAARALLAWESE